MFHSDATDLFRLFFFSGALAINAFACFQWACCQGQRCYTRLFPDQKEARKG